MRNSRLFSLVLALGCTWFCHAQPLSFTPYHANGVYQLNEKAGWNVTLARAPGVPKHYRYVIRKNNLDQVQNGELDLSSGHAMIETKLNEPAMLYVEIIADGPVDDRDNPAAARPAGPAGGKTIATHLGAAIAPWKLAPSVPRPSDFDSFWDAKLKALREVPIQPSLTPTSTAKPGVELYTVKLDSLNSHVQGYLAKPTKEGKFPALMIYQYAGVYALKPETVTDRAAEGWLAFDVDSHDIPPTEETGVSRSYQAIGNTDRETSYFLNMYLRDARAIDYIKTRPDWDGKTIVLMGTSMGGQQSLVTAGLRPEVTAVVVNEPSGADSDGDLHGRKAGYPNWPSNDPKVMATALYFDTVNFASRIQAPVVAALGFIDTIAPPVGIWTAVNQVPGPKEIIPMVESDHNNLTPQKQGAWNTRSKEVLETILAGRKFEPNEELTAKGK
ncbi:MAG TPA: acetylxylan esterase [Bryobacteraceae bacterium]|nr:acetylxylan esterase [Bryobacteraceae bacterium]